MRNSKYVKIKEITLDNTMFFRNVEFTTVKTPDFNQVKLRTCFIATLTDTPYFTIKLFL